MDYPRAALLTLAFSDAIEYVEMHQTGFAPVELVGPFYAPIAHHLAGFVAFYDGLHR